VCGRTSRMRWHLTDEEKRQIKKLTRAKIRQSEISKLLRVGRDTVAKWQMRMGLPTRSPLPAPEEKIMRLFERGLGGYTIAKRLHIPAYRVFKVAHKNNFHRKHNTGFADPEANVEGFIAAVKRRDDHIVNLAEKFNIGKVKANKIAHEVLKTLRFRSGRSKPPLSSNFPQRAWGPRVASAKS